MRYQLRQGGVLLPEKFTSKATLDAHIEAHLEKGGLDWRAGYLFKSRLDVEPIEVIVMKTGEPLRK